MSVIFKSRTMPRPTSSLMELRGVRVHNLKNIDLDIPLGQLVVISGVSGSGKGSLAFDTLLAEGQRRYIESFSVAARQHLEKVERPNADRIAQVPVAVAIRSEQSRRSQSDLRSTVASVAELFDGLRLLFARAGRIICLDCRCEVKTHSSADVVDAVSSLAPKTRCQLGFMAAQRDATDSGATWLARGFSRAIWDGVTHDLATKPAWPKTGDIWIVVDRLTAGSIVPNRIIESAETAFREGGGRCWLLIEVDGSQGDVHVVDGRNWSFKRFSRRLECSTCGRQYLPIEPRLLSHLASGACLTCRGTGRDANDPSNNTVCLACKGTRYRDEALAVRVADRSIADIFRGTAPDVLQFLQDIHSTLSAAVLPQTQRIRDEIDHRLKVVCDLGLDYLTLDRSATTLSGGEYRRLMLASVIGSRITGTLVVIDEPSAGLAVSELPRVVAALRRVQHLHNSVVAVDHAPLIVSSADHVVELGPGAGPNGGQVVFQGSPGAGQSSDDSQQAVSGRAPSQRLKKGIKKISLSKIHFRNLQNLDLEFPLNQVCVVTGTSGSGKTSLLTQVVYPSVCRQLGLPCPVDMTETCELKGADGLVDVVLIDQSPLARSSRSNPATWLEVFDEIRQTFASTSDAKVRGFTARHFSFNSPNGGRCPSCEGSGLLQQEMQFLADVSLPCPECGGARYGKEILKVKYRGRSIADVLAMSVSEAATFFRSQPRIQRRFQMLKLIGLDYVVLGQPSETLSGGEAQRLKLAARISAPNRGPCLILCDEPTDGLHPADIALLINGFRELVANGHSLILADNSPELLSAADDVLELSRRS